MVKFVGEGLSIDLSMFITREELAKRRRSENDLTTRMKVPVPSPAREIPFDPSRFKVDGTATQMPRLTPELRAAIAATSIVVGPKEAAEIFNVSESHAKALRSADFNPSDIDEEKREEKKEELKEGIYEALGKIREEAQNKLMLVLGVIDEKSLEAIAPKDKARLAAQMANQLSGVIDRTIQKAAQFTDARSTHLHLYVPEQRRIDAFDIKKVNPLPEGESDALSAAE